MTITIIIVYTELQIETDIRFGANCKINPNEVRTKKDQLPLK